MAERRRELRENVELDAFMIMPNHVHGIVVITDGRGTARRAPTEAIRQTVCARIPTPNRIIVRGASNPPPPNASTQIRNTPGTPVWQRNYYEHVIRNDEELNAIRQYILTNPANWTTDENYHA